MIKDLKRVGLVVLFVTVLQVSAFADAISKTGAVENVIIKIIYLF